ncbi:MAG TPA: nuclear transport factor 2 family protein [Luteimonas sp.]|nr:nuclear transport factor 2 family protein [Luteimonas sp.]HRO27215.1 nuclear transport factor 2 family protein [Luteimonas sp.]HRP72912.1 nuclear transport factor 2 family protein [Luteimonas sp.]
MTRPSAILAVLLAIAGGAHAAEAPPLSPPDSELYRIVAGLDAQLFDAYNRCDLDAFRALLADDLEFYHDQGGLMLGADAVTEATRKHICGKVRRELVPGTLEVDRIEGYGAIELGSHRFCELESEHCMGIARFVQVWKRDGDSWKATRIISFGHRALEGGE